MDKKRVSHRCGRHRHTLPQDHTQSAASVSFYSRKRFKSENGSVNIELTHQDPSLIHPLTPKMDASAQGSSPRSEIVHLGGGVQEDGLVLKSILTAPRAPEVMFFPALKDSSLKAEAEERARREAVLQKNLQGKKRPLEDRHVRNAAVLPDLRDPPAPNLLDAQEMVLQSVLTAPRAPEVMFFPALKDSSLKAEAEERARREAVLQKNLQGKKRPLEDRHVRNAAILPDLRDPPAPNLLDAQEMVLQSVLTAPRAPEVMFFPALKDSSLKAEAEERARREAVLQKNLQGKKHPLEDRHIRNAAILPDLRDPPAPNLLDAQEMVLQSVLTAPRAPEVMFFPALKDSSLKPEAELRPRRESERQGNLQGKKRPMEDRHVHNAAVLPDLRDPPTPSFLTAQEMNLISGHACPEGPLGIHNRTVEQYKQIYNSVVDPVPRSTSSRSLALGRSNKQRLWEALGGPSLHWANVGQAGQLQVWETYDVTALHSVVHIDLDTSLEPDSPPQPRRKRARH